MRRRKSVYQGWKGTSGLLGYSPIIKHLAGDPEGACDGFKSVLSMSIILLDFLRFLLPFFQLLLFRHLVLLVLEAQHQFVLGIPKLPEVSAQFLFLL